MDQTNSHTRHTTHTTHTNHATRATHTTNTADSSDNTSLVITSTSSDTTATGNSTSTEENSLLRPDLYIHRELSWIEFNRRVFEEAQNERHPLLERVKFISIFETNLDEFIMITARGYQRPDCFEQNAP